jgi:hypothetical protein
MKTILFNGCSFVAGDAVAWDRYCMEKFGEVLPWGEAQHLLNARMANAMLDYRFNWRRQYNLPKQTADLLSAEVVDLSEDGNSNDNIALSTIAYLLNKSPKERAQYHVCIGWSALLRLLKYNPYTNRFVTLHIQHSQGIDDPSMSKLAGFVEHAITRSTDSDFVVNYVRNIMLLENFLIANNITYTFFRALGCIEDCDPTIGPFYSALDVAGVQLLIPKATVTNHLNWYAGFTGDHMIQYPFAGPSWATKLMNDGPKLSFISDTNLHPNGVKVYELSHQLANFISNRKVL